MSELQDFRDQKDEFFATSPHSPLTQEQQDSFDGLRYFDENPGLDLTVEVNEFDEKDTIEMQTTTGGTQSYNRFGRFQFEVDGQEVELTIYHNQNGYFLPFVDGLAGEETYPAGRYLEPERLEDGRFHIDFNHAYNPYCAYNEAWTCPITPFENRVEVPIRAGEKIFDSESGWSH
ncbi:MAG: DUF1684 domain-containing protein [Anaerolineales bacterium]|nr:DUF1684 domain-containing protein [Anaerolineales bacterium]